MLSMRRYLLRGVPYNVFTTKYYYSDQYCLFSNYYLYLCIVEAKASVCSTSYPTKEELLFIQYAVPMEQGYNKGVAPIHIRYMSGTCPIDVRYISGQVPDTYRTSTGHIQDKYRTTLGGTLRLHMGCNMDRMEVN